MGARGANHTEFLRTHGPSPFFVSFCFLLLNTYAKGSGKVGRGVDTMAVGDVHGLFLLGYVSGGEDKGDHIIGNLGTGYGDYIRVMGMDMVVMMDGV